MVGPSKEITSIIFLLILMNCDFISSSTSVEVSKEKVEGITGDIVLRYGNGFFSEQFRLYASLEDKTYSHAGIIHLDNDSLFVYHAEANEMTGVGFVKKEPLVDFLKNAKAYGIYRMDCKYSIKEKMIAKAKYYFDKKTKFDLKFDSQNDDEVYCTELVANAINYGFGEKVITPKIKLNGKLLYGVDGLYLNKGFYLTHKK